MILLSNYSKRETANKLGEKVCCIYITNIDPLKVVRNAKIVEMNFVLFKKCFRILY